MSEKYEIPDVYQDLPVFYQHFFRKLSEEVMPNTCCDNDCGCEDEDVLVDEAEAGKWIWNEPDILDGIYAYIERTYGEHYAGDKKIQFTEYFENKHSFEETLGALRFNAGKYLDRYGKKKGYNKDDLMKTVHYLVMLISLHDKHKGEG